MKELDKKSAATIVDIAKIAGIHPSTVSRVFSGKAPVKKETADLVLKIAEDLGFQINREARKLVKGEPSSRVIGIAVPAFTHPFYMEILKGIQCYFHKQAINLMLFNLGNREDEVFERIVEEGLSGLLVISFCFDDEKVERLRRSRTAVVFIDNEHPQAPSLIVNNRLGGQIAAEELINRGCKDILYVGESFDSPQQRERRDGFLFTLKNEGFKEPSEVFVKQFRGEVEQKILPVLKKHNYDGIFCFCDEIAYGVQAALKKLERPTPLIGFDDLVPSQYLELTTVAQPAFQLGFQGSQLLSQMIEGHKPLISRLILEPLLIRRRT